MIVFVKQGLAWLRHENEKSETSTWKIATKEKTSKKGDLFDFCVERRCVNGIVKSKQQCMPDPTRYLSRKRVFSGRRRKQDDQTRKTWLGYVRLSSNERNTIYNAWSAPLQSSNYCQVRIQQTNNLQLLTYFQWNLNQTRSAYEDDKIAFKCKITLQKRKHGIICHC